MSYRFSEHSLSELQGIRAELVIAATEALQHCATLQLDFMVFDGLRTEAEQRKNIAKGVSWTMNSKHLRQSDGYGHAMDLVPIVDGRLKWDSPIDAEQQIITMTYNACASSIQHTCQRYGFDIRWGYDMWGKDWPHFQWMGNV